MNAQQIQGQNKLFEALARYGLAMAERAGHLKGRESEILRLRMGLQDGENPGPWSLDAIAEKEEISAERVNQLSRRGLKRLSTALEEEAA